jgi:hypothetical protein
MLKINFMNWLRRSSHSPTYEASQKKKKKKGGDGDSLNDKAIFHKYLHFYDTSLMVVPEYCYENKLDNFKPKDIQILKDWLSEKDAEEEARASQLKEQENASPTKGGGKADPKKDAKGKAPAKGAPTEEKPAVNIDYPEIEETLNFLILEKQYNGKPQPVVSNKKKGATTVKENKTKERQDELLAKYKLIKPLPI